MKAKSKFAAIPYLVWMLIFIIVPLGMVLFFGFTTKGGEFTFDNFTGIAKYAHVFWKSIYLSVIATVICLILAFPLGFLMSRMSEVGQRTMLMLIMLPMWMINTKGAVVLGMVYNYLPFAITPLHSIMVKIDKSVIEAAQDLGANGFRVFTRVLLPLSIPGIITAITMVFVPSVSTFIISRMLGGGQNILIGDLIEQQFLGSVYNPYVGSAMSLILMVIILLIMSVINHFDDDEMEGMIV